MALVGSKGQKGVYIISYQSINQINGNWTWRRFQGWEESPPPRRGWHRPSQNLCMYPPFHSITKLGFLFTTLLAISSCNWGSVTAASLVIQFPTISLLNCTLHPVSSLCHREADWYDIYYSLYLVVEKSFYNRLWLWFMQGLGPYSTSIKKVEKEIKDMAKKVNDLCGMCEIAVLSLANADCNIWIIVFVNRTYWYRLYSLIEILLEVLLASSAIIAFALPCILLLFFISSIFFCGFASHSL